MKEFILILFAHVGPMGNGNSNALLSVPGFVSRQECEAVIPLAKDLVLGTVKKIEGVCIERTKP